MSEKTILVLFGGCSVEYEVSLASGREVLAAMAETRYRPLPVRSEEHTSELQSPF